MLALLPMLASALTTWGQLGAAQPRAAQCKATRKPRSRPGCRTLSARCQGSFRTPAVPSFSCCHASTSYSWSQNRGTRSCSCLPMRFLVVVVVVVARVGTGGSSCRKWAPGLGGKASHGVQSCGSPTARALVPPAAAVAPTLGVIPTDTCLSWCHLRARALRDDQLSSRDGVWPGNVLFAPLGTELAE